MDIPLDYPTLRVIWWGLMGVLLIGFALTDGFDLGVAALLPFVARNDGGKVTVAVEPPIASIRIDNQVKAVPGNQCKGEVRYNPVTQADGVSEQDTGPQRRGVEGLGDGLVLVAELAGEHAGRDGQRVVAEGDGGLAEGGLHPEAGAPVLG